MRTFTVLCALALASCSAVGPTSRLSREIGTEIFEDVPSPAAARYDDAGGRSFSFQGPAYRCGRFVFSIEGTVEEAASFYRGTMTQPPYSWTLTNEKMDGAVLVLSFEKGEDRCVVQIDRRKDHVQVVARVNYRG
ncbi:MAG: hypothetical protein ACE5JG_02865 [Planctomycetota bacterium]